MVNFYAYISMRGISTGIFISLWIVFFTDTGLNLFNVGLIGAVLEFSRMLFEVPTGVFADRYGRKVSLSLAALIYIPALLMFIVAASPSYAYLAAFVFGLADSFQSGSYEAWLMDFLKGRKEERIFREKLTAAYVFYYVFSFIASVSAGIFYRINPNLILYIAITANLIAFLFSLGLKEVFFAVKEERESYKNQFWGNIRETFSLIKTEKALYLLFLLRNFHGFGRRCCGKILSTLFTRYKFFNPENCLCLFCQHATGNYYAHL